MKWLKEQGFEPEPLKATQKVLQGEGFRYFSAPDEVRLQELQEAFSGKYQLIWMARGGSGLARLLPGLDSQKLAPTPFLGFSDGTALLNLLTGLEIPAVHGPVMQTLCDHIDEPSRQALLQVLAGAGLCYQGKAVFSGEAKGKLVGGNLCVLASLCGTPWALKSAGCIVLLEDIQEPPYKIDRLLTQLIQSGGLNGCIGVALGQFIGCDAPEGADWSLKDLLKERLEPLKIPVVAGLPFGHGSSNHAICFGEAVLDGKKGILNSSSRLQL
jgi:muramoyltetrapeptide carboxypeptidase